MLWKQQWDRTAPHFLLPPIAPQQQVFEGDSGLMLVFFSSNKDMYLGSVVTVNLF